MLLDDELRVKAVDTIGCTGDAGRVGTLLSGTLALLFPAPGTGEVARVDGTVRDTGFVTGALFGIRGSLFEFHFARISSAQAVDAF